MRILGLDMGSRTIGLAISDELGITAQGVGTLRRTEPRKDVQELKERVVALGVTQLVVGLPRRLDGTLGPAAQGVWQFVEVMRKEISLPIVLWDERLSTVAVERTLLEADLSRRKRRRLKDKLAAVVILQNYLDSCHIKKG